ncbi:uncharacterized protein PRCAT00002357001 [Priceomyces carsonii]|uniref:uncharacterized protein n=1 Tax=Priceomyces carsonii TaxID=28549 RepID=UPI002ED9292C|nr:unnamed protein product [Priceomyces carsonii]
MWPCKSGLGNILGYGVKGNGIVASEKSVDDEHNNATTIKVEFPRKLDDASSIKEIEGSKSDLVGSQVPIFTLNSRIYNKFELAVSSSYTERSEKLMYNDPKMYIPRDILKSYLVESNSLTSTIAYDPTFGRLFSLSEIRTRNGNYSAKIMAYVTGETGNIFNISTVDYRRIEIRNKSSQTSEIYTPEILKPFQVAFSEPIKQIEFSLKSFGFIPSFVLIRSASKIYIVSCYKSGRTRDLQRSKVEMDLVSELGTNDLSRNEFADVAFNPWDYTQFSAVDVKGNFGVWNIRRERPNCLKRVNFNIDYEVGEQNTTSVPKCSPSISDSEELSNWKRIIWGGSEGSLIVISRSSATQFTIIPKLTSFELISAKTWSKIQDVFRNERYAFLLTSKELIWLSISPETKRILSWKHFLDDQDPSLKLHVCKKQGHNYICLIYSQMHPLIFVYTFGFRDEKPCSLRDPYFIRRAKDMRGVQQVHLATLNRNFFTLLNDLVQEEDLVSESDLESDFQSEALGLFELTTDLDLSINLFSEVDGLTTIDEKEEWNPQELNKKKTKVAIGRYHLFKKFSKKLFSYVYSDIAKVNKKMHLDDEIKRIQDYAFKLGEGSAVVHKEDFTYHSLMDISSTMPPLVANISEFDSMIEQLSKYYKEKSIDISNIEHAFYKHSTLFSSFTRASRKNNILNLFGALNEVYTNEKLKQFNSIENVRLTAILIGTSLLKASSTNLERNHADQFSDEIKISADHVKAIVEEWDHDELEIFDDFDSKEDKFQSQVSIPQISSSIPSINITTQEKNTRKVNSKRRILKTFARRQKPSSSQNSIVSASQSQEPFEPGHLLSSQMKGASSQESLLNSQNINTSSRRFIASQNRFSTSQSNSQKKAKKRKGGFQ